jgi:hypothetical protein
MEQLPVRTGMGRKRVFALMAMATLGLFCGILLWFVPRLDLAGAVLLGLGLAAYDVWDQLFRRGAPGN